MFLELDYKILSDDDMITIRRLAKKYSMSVTEFGRTISKVGTSTFNRHIRTNNDEYATIKNKAEMAQLSMSAYCVKAAACLVKSGIESINFTLLNDKRDKKNSDNKRTQRISISFPSERAYKEICDIATQYNIKYATLIRYSLIHYDDSTDSMR